MVAFATPPRRSANATKEPFGGIAAMSGLKAEENRFRFSTKYQDDESGLSYYGYRYYGVGTGRWLNRDPKEERGGTHLYGFVRNRALDSIDPLGKDCIVLSSRRIFASLPGWTGAHYSLYFLRTCCPDVGAVMPWNWRWRLTAERQVELLGARPVQVDYRTAWGTWRPRVLSARMGISVVEYNVLDRLNIETEFVNVYDDSDPRGPADGFWSAMVIPDAANYRYAEQDADRMPGDRTDGNTILAQGLVNFPQSVYHFTKNNSNVFARWLIQANGMQLTELPAHHPPNWTVPRPLTSFYSRFRNPRPVPAP
jgi:RHS repeat-associated protein